MTRLNNKQKILCLSIFLFLLFLLFSLNNNENFKTFTLTGFDKNNNDNNSEFKYDNENGFIINFENDGLEKLVKEFNTKSYSKIEDNSNCDSKSWTGELSENDPTCGNVRYINVIDNNKYDENKDSEKLIQVNNKKLELKLGTPKKLVKSNKDDKDLFNYLSDEKNKSNVYPSIRLTSNKKFENTKQHLFILKAKLPFGKAIWPAWWLTGSDGEQSTINTEWPTNGEIDIIELVNDVKSFKNVLHMCTNCKSRWKRGPKYPENERDSEWGQETECQGEYGTSGCFSGNDYTNNYTVTGDGNVLETEPSGIFACWWNPLKTKASDGKEILGEINFYYWKYNDKLPNENGPLSENPNPSTWKDNLMTTAQYWKETENRVKETQKACSEKDNKTNCQFNNMRMIFNTTLCGDWAGNAFPGGEGGPPAVKRCLDYLDNNLNSDTIRKQKWEIDYIAAFSK